MAAENTRGYIGLSIYLYLVFVTWAEESRL
jgi:hypothetical protein